MPVRARNPKPECACARPTARSRNGRIGSMPGQPGLTGRFPFTGWRRWRRQDPLQKSWRAGSGHAPVGGGGGSKVSRSARAAGRFQAGEPVRQAVHQAWGQDARDRRPPPRQTAETRANSKGKCQGRRRGARTGSGGFSTGWKGSSARAPACPRLRPSSCSGPFLSIGGQALQALSLGGSPMPIASGGIAPSSQSAQLTRLAGEPSLPRRPQECGSWLRKSRGKLWSFWFRPIALQRS